MALLVQHIASQFGIKRKAKGENEQMVLWRACDQRTPGESIFQLPMLWQRPGCRGSLSAFPRRTIVQLHVHYDCLEKAP